MIRVPEEVTATMFLHQTYDEDAPGQLAEMGLVVAKRCKEVP